jgi:hypothetical protein
MPDFISKGEVIKPKFGHLPTTNGCGSYGIEVNIK